MKSVLFPALFALVCGVSSAQEYPEFVRWMKSSDQASKALQKLDKKVGPQATRAAEAMGGVYEEMIGFFRQRKSADAIKWSQEGKAAALDLANAAYASDANGAEAAFKSLSGTCRSCHNVYRERAPDGKYRWKTLQPREERSSR
jgi:hypothetical protein